MGKGRKCTSGITSIGVCPMEGKTLNRGDVFSGRGLLKWAKSDCVLERTSELPSNRQKQGCSGQNRAPVSGVRTNQTASTSISATRGKLHICATRG